MWEVELALVEIIRRERWRWPGGPGGVRCGLLFDVIRNRAWHILGPDESSLNDRGRLVAHYEAKGLDRAVAEEIPRSCRVL